MQNARETCMCARSFICEQWIVRYPSKKPTSFRGMRPAICTVLIISLALSVSNSEWSFVEEVRSRAALTVLEMKGTPTERACQAACANNEKCLAISYSPCTCILLGEETADKMCSEPVKVSTKQQSIPA
ncbi:hypothetical protein PMAYCL1PPCAC_03283, partial [Pristionchus mayeri]